MMSSQSIGTAEDKYARSLIGSPVRDQFERYERYKNQNVNLSMNAHGIYRGHSVRQRWSDWQVAYLCGRQAK